MIRRALTLMLPLLVLLATPAADAAGARETGMRETGGTLATGGTALVDLGAAPGDYLRGRLTVESGRFDLDLVDGAGVPLRRFGSDIPTARSFHHVVGAADERLQLRAVEAGRWRIELEPPIPMAEQRVPEPEPLSPAIAALARDLARGGDTAGFWADMAARGTPLVEPADRPDRRIVTFLARGARHNVRLFGGPGTGHDELQRLGNADVWYRSYVLPSDTRLAYQLAPDVPEFAGTARERRVAVLATAAADLLNRHPWPADAPDIWARDSLLVLDDAPAQPWADADASVPQGRLDQLRLTSRRLGNTRDVTLYRPAGFDPARPDTVLLILFDGRDYRQKVPVPRILDAMIAAGVIPPVVAVLVDSLDQDTRGRELPGNPDFADMLAHELLPMVRAAAGFDPDPARTVLSGSSFGGLAAMTAALRHPGVFGNVLSMSGSFWWSPPGTPETGREWVAGRVAAAAMPPPLRVFLAAGIYETSGDGVTASILDTNRHLRDVLMAKGVWVRHREYATGHDYVAWQGVLSDGLVALFGRDQP